LATFKCPSWSVVLDQAVTLRCKSSRSLLITVTLKTLKATSDSLSTKMLSLHLGSISLLLMLKLSVLLTSYLIFVPSQFHLPRFTSRLMILALAILRTLASSVSLSLVLSVTSLLFMPTSISETRTSILQLYLSLSSMVITLWMLLVSRNQSLLLVKLLLVLTLKLLTVM